MSETHSTAEAQRRGVELSSTIKKHIARVPMKLRYTADEEQLLRLSLMCEVAKEYERRGLTKDAEKAWLFVEEYPLDELLARIERAQARRNSKKGGRK